MVCSAGLPSGRTGTGAAIIIPETVCSVTRLDLSHAFQGLSSLPSFALSRATGMYA